MDRRKKRTSTNQYMMYIDLMEKDSIFASGRVPRDVDANYLQKKWKELSDKLNTCNSGPHLTSEEWRKRLNDWKNTTRCKYRRSISDEKGISLTSLEQKALDLFGKAPHITTSSDHLSIHLKSEKDDGDDEMEQRASESFQKELQAAVEEAIGGDDDEDNMVDDQDEHDDDEQLSDPLTTTVNNSNSGEGGAGNGGRTNSGNASATYRTIVVENAQFTDEDNNDEHLEFITHRRHTIVPSATSHTAETGVQTVVSTAPTTTVTKLINGDIPLKRLRTHAPEQIIYEVKKAPISHHPSTQRNITTVHNVSSITPNHIHHHQQQQSLDTSTSNCIQQTCGSNINFQDAREISRQLKRLADIKSEKLKFEIARFKFNNPGFHYNYNPL